MLSKEESKLINKQLDDLYTKTIADPAPGVPDIKSMLKYLHKKVINGWELIFSYQILQDGDIERKMYILSAMLYPHGRSSFNHDWHFIGWVIGNYENRIGVPNKLLTPIETTDPNGILKWIWINPDKELTIDKINASTVI